MARIHVRIIASESTVLLGNKEGLAMKTAVLAPLLTLLAEAGISGGPHIRT